MNEDAKGGPNWIIYKDVEILVADYSNQSFTEVPISIDKVTEEIVNSGKKDILLLVDARDSNANKEIADRLLESAKIVTPYCKKTATIGIVGLKKVLLNSINLFTKINVKALKTFEEAKEWLIS